MDDIYDIVIIDNVDEKNDLVNSKLESSVIIENEYNDYINQDNKSSTEKKDLVEDINLYEDNKELVYKKNSDKINLLNKNNNSYKNNLYKKIPYSKIPYRNRLWSKVNYLNKSIKNVSKKTTLKNLEHFFWYC